MTWARDHLRIFWKGEEAEGLLFYGLRRRRHPTVPQFPTSWAARTQVNSFLLHGDGWEVVLWEVWTPGWLLQEKLDSLVSECFEALHAAGSVVTWMGVEGGFVDPPHLFDPEHMAESVVVAWSASTGRVGRLLLDAPLRFLGAADLEALRESSAGLASSNGPPLVS